MVIHLAHPGDRDVTPRRGGADLVATLIDPAWNRVTIRLSRP